MLDAPPTRVADTFLCVAGEMFLPLAEGALWWPEQETLIVSDLHLEKGSSFARRGQFIPPYDTASTLTSVEKLVRRLGPKRVISLGDSFHDRRAEERLDETCRGRIRALTSTTNWLWVEGNHDPAPPENLGGTGTKEFRLGPCVFRHEPTNEPGELSGHLHPVARIKARGRSIRRKCFITDGSRLVMPSLGAFTGGLNALDSAITGLFPRGTMVFATSGNRVMLIDNRTLAPDCASALKH